MSNKPRINAFCDAGCKWETVHKADFMKSASHVPVLVNADGNYYLEKGKEYKIFAPKDASGQFTCGVNFVYQSEGAASTTAYRLTHENEDKYAESFVFKLLDASLNAAADTIILIYEIAGIRYEETIGSGSEYYSLLTENYLYVSGASAVYLFNSDATIIAKDGEDGKDGKSGSKMYKHTLYFNVNTSEEQIWSSSWNGRESYTKEIFTDNATQLTYQEAIEHIGNVVTINEYDSGYTSEAQFFIHGMYANFQDMGYQGYTGTQTNSSSYNERYIAFLSSGYIDTVTEV